MCARPESLFCSRNCLFLDNSHSMAVDSLSRFPLLCTAHCLARKWFNFRVALLGTHVDWTMAVIFIYSMTSNSIAESLATKTHRIILSRFHCIRTLFGKITRHLLRTWISRETFCMNDWGPSFYFGDQRVLCMHLTAKGFSALAVLEHWVGCTCSNPAHVMHR